MGTAREKQLDDYRVRREAIIEDVEWMVSAREYPSRIAERLGYRHLHSLTSSLRVWDKSALADKLLES